MPSLLDQKNKTALYRIATAQFAVTLLVTLVLLALFGFRAAYSALLAGSISTLATLYVGWKFFFGAVKSSRERLASLYLAELVKLIFLATAFCAGFLLFEVQFLSFIGAYIATIFVYWLAMIWPAFGVQIKTIIKN